MVLVSKGYRLVNGTGWQRVQGSEKVPVSHSAFQVCPTGISMIVKKNTKESTDVGVKWNLFKKSLQ